MDDGAPLATQRAPHPIQISVTDPVKRMEDSIIPGVKGGYYTYLVTTVTDQPGFSRRRMEVRRRFSDFVVSLLICWQRKELHGCRANQLKLSFASSFVLKCIVFTFCCQALADLLAVTHRGYFVFPRPDKSVVEGQIGKKDFVEQRRGALEKYLQKLATHAVVATSEARMPFKSAFDGGSESLCGHCVRTVIKPLINWLNCAMLWITLSVLDAMSCSASGIASVPRDRGSPGDLLPLDAAGPAQGQHPGGHLKAAKAAAG